MKKKHYQSPTMKMVELKQSQMLCGSFTTSQNESYSVGTITDWYNTEE